MDMLSSRKLVCVPASHSSTMLIAVVGVDGGGRDGDDGTFAAEPCCLMAEPCTLPVGGGACPPALAAVSAEPCACNGVACPLALGMVSAEPCVCNGVACPPALATVSAEPCACDGVACPPALGMVLAEPCSYDAVGCCC